MKHLERNKQPFWYALYLGEDYIKDGDGHITSERGATYGEPVQMFANISKAHGSSEAELFGTNLDYDKTIVTDILDCPITENSMLCIDKEYDGENWIPDYRVKRVAKTLNAIAYALQRIDVS